MLKNNVARKAFVFMGVMVLAGLSLTHASEFQVSAITKFAAAQIKIEQLRKQDPTDWDAIHEAYAVMADIVRQTDSKHGTGYDQAIIKALQNCRTGQSPKVNQQIIAKGLQHVAVLNICDQMDAILAGSSSAGNKIFLFFEGIRPTFSRRDKDFFKSRKTLEKDADIALTHLRQGNTEDVLTYKLDLENILFRTYALCVLYEVQQIEKHAHVDTGTCDVKHLEAVVFYNIVSTKIKRTNAKVDEIIWNLLNGSYSAMSAAVLKDYLEKGLGLRLL